MAWGARTGVDDLLQRLQQPKTGKNLCVLSVRKITEADVKKLAGAIASNTILEELYLSGHKLGAEGVAAFAECLAQNSTLRHLSIGEDALGDANLAVLCSGLARNAQSALQVWDLEFKSIGVDGAAALGELLATSSTLQSLSLARNEIRDEGVKRLASGLQANEKSGLETLSWIETGITGAALDELASVLTQPHCTLKTLQLSFNALTGASGLFFAAIGKNQSLKKLYLKETKLGDRAAIALADALKTNSSLEEVDLSDNELSSAAFEALAAALKINTTLKSLTLGNNKGGDIGAQSLGDALTEHNTTLELLDLSNNQLTHVGIGRVLAAKATKELRFFNNALGDGLVHMLPALLANSSVETLDLGANALHGDLSIQLFDAVHTHPSLKTLEVGGNSLGQEGHAALERLRQANTAIDVAVDKNAQKEDGSFDFEA